MITHPDPVNSLTSNLYVDDEKPTTNFTITHLLDEVLLSYALLFADDRSARKLYRKTERVRASLPNTAGEPIVDPLLDRLCGTHLSISIFSFGRPVRENYDAQSDFPCLRPRLKRLNDYMSGVEPSRLRSLWRDRRDLRLWYTIWAVIILGGITILQAFVSIFLSAAQLAIAEKTYRLQLDQST
jgi:hypothetical protein